MQPTELWTLITVEAAPSPAAAVGVVTEDVGPTITVVQLIGTRSGGTIERAVRGGSFSAGALEGAIAVG